MLIKPISFWQQPYVAGVPPTPSDKSLYLNGYNLYNYNGTRLGLNGGGGIGKVSLEGVLDTSWCDNANPTGQTNQVRFSATTGDYIFADVRTTNSSTRGFRKIAKSDGTIASTVATSGGTIWFVAANPSNTDFVIVTGDNTNTTFNGTVYKGVGKINTSNLTVDTTFKTNMGSGVNAFVNSSYVGEYGIGVSGQFTSWNGNTTYQRFVVLNHDGTRDTSFVRSGTFNNHAVTSLYIDGKWIVGGQFTTYNGVTNNRLVCFNSDGSVDTTFTTNLGTGFNNTVQRLIKLTNTSFLVVGAFTTINGGTANRMAVVNTDGTIPTQPFGTGFNNAQPTWTDVDYDTGIIYATGAGPFTAYNGTTTKNIISINSDGSVNTTFDYGGTTGGLTTITSTTAETGGCWIA